MADLKTAESGDLHRQLESKEEYKKRHRSLMVIYFTTFLMALGFSIVITGVWPYLDKVRSRSMAQ